MTADQTYDIDVEDVEYIRHGDKPLLARLFKPARARAVSGYYRTPRWSLVSGRSSDGRRHQRTPGKKWCGRGRTRFPGAARSLVSRLTG